MGHGESVAALEAFHRESAAKALGWKGVAESRGCLAAEQDGPAKARGDFFDAKGEDHGRSLKAFLAVGCAIASDDRTKMDDEAERRAGLVR